MANGPMINPIVLCTYQADKFATITNTNDQQQKLIKLDNLFSKVQKEFQYCVHDNGARVAAYITKKLLQLELIQARISEHQTQINDYEKHLTALRNSHSQKKSELNAIKKTMPAKSGVESIFTFDELTLLNNTNECINAYKTQPAEQTAAISNFKQALEALKPFFNPAIDDGDTSDSDSGSEYGTGASHSDESDAE